MQLLTYETAYYIGSENDESPLAAETQLLLLRLRRHTAQQVEPLFVHKYHCTVANCPGRNRNLLHTAAAAFSRSVWHPFVSH